MEPELYEQRARHKTLPLDFQYQNAEGYTSNWDYLKTNFSNYHFDKFKDEHDGEWVHRLGRFQLTDAQKALIPGFIEKSKEVGWFDVTSKHHPGFPGGKSPLLEIEEYDRIAAGQGGKEFVQVVPEPEMATTPIQALGDYWKMKRSRTRIHVQMPGQIFPMHIDKLWHRYPADPGKLLRIVINLEDYEPGQVLVYGNVVMTQWRAGDVHCFDTLNVPHSTANMSTKPRVMMIVTGVRTEDTDKLLRESNPNKIISNF